MVLMGVMEMTVMKIIDMALVGNCCVAAAWSVDMSVVFDNVTRSFHRGILHREESWNQASAPPLAANHGKSGHPGGIIIRQHCCPHLPLKAMSVVWIVTCLSG